MRPSQQEVVSMGWVGRWFASCLVAVALGGAYHPVHAQYFGRNKVQYKTFDFQVLRTEHFDIYFYPEERAAAQQASLMAERWYARLARFLTHDLIGRQPLILYGSHTDFEQTNVVEGELGEGTGGVTEGLKRRIVLPLGGSLAETDHVIGHELVHAFQYDIGGVGGPTAAASGGGLERLPLWFIEGMAEYLSLGPIDANTAMWMRDAASQEKIPSIHELSNPRYFPYRWGQALWAYLTGRYGDDVLSTLLRTGAASGDAETALQIVLGLEKLDDLSDDWHKALRDQASQVRQHTVRVTDTARPLQRATNDLTAYNVSPSLSPDGRYLMFLSQRDVLSIDLFLADAQTGQVLRKVVNTAFDPHFSSLGFINSAGAWSPDGRQFVFSAVQGGKPTLVIVDVRGSTTEREIPFRDVGEIFSPSWSPDGKSIAFSAQQGGWTDLYVYDMAAGKTRRLTQDAYADLQPAWSPDASRLIFVSDRFTTKLPELAAGAYQLVSFEFASGQMRVVRGAEIGKNINPQFGRDGEVYFVSDRTGISNVYRVKPDGGVPIQVTNVSTGVSGITALSPAISLAPAVNRLAFSLYENNKYNIYAMDADRLAAGALRATVAEINPAQLPPERRKSGELVALQQNMTIGLPSAANATTSEYDGHLKLDTVGQPFVAAGIDPYGLSLGGGIALSFSDELGDYSLGTAIQVNGDFGAGLTDVARNIGGQVVFLNRKHRWNYGLAGGQIPYTAAAFSSGVANGADGSTTGVNQLTIYRQVERSASGILAYPFNAAQRLEASAGLMNISFDQRVETTTFDLATGTVIAEQRQTVPGPSSLNLAQFSAALVYDTSRFGATSPIAGQSYRLQVTPTLGTLRFATVLADYRRYFMPVSFYTVAARVLHYGRYGQSSEDARLVPMYLGYPDLVRGYDASSFASNECTPTPRGTCQEFDRLIGSRLAVANLELRFPLLRPFGMRPEMYGPLPIEVAIFADAGVAWSAGEKPRVFGGDRQGVSSVGVAVRTNLFGALVAEFDIARPFQRPRNGWVFQFNLSPGF
jgi:Tol biopolymer transport system component